MIDKKLDRTGRGESYSPARSVQLFTVQNFARRVFDIWKENAYDKLGYQETKNNISLKGSVLMEMKKVSISAKRQITIPQKFFFMLGFDAEAECNIPDP